MLNALLSRPKRLAFGLPIAVLGLRIACGWHLWLIAVAALALPLWLAALWCAAFVAWARPDRPDQPWQ